MKIRHAVYIVVFILIVAIIFFLFRQRSPFGAKNTSFASHPEQEITGIELSDSHSRLILSVTDGRWMINHKTEARKNSILFITSILEGMEIKSPVSSELFNSEIREKGIVPVRVKVTEKGKVLKSFLVYKTSSNIYGNIMKLKESSKPFIVYVPGNEVEIGSAFTMNELFWQPYTVFRLMPSEISSVTFSNLNDSAASFRIEHSGNKFRLFADNMQLSGWDTSLVRRYISYFTHVPFEQWAFDLPENEKHSIQDSRPLYRIDVTETDGRTKSLSLWERSFDDQGVKKADTDRLYARMDDTGELCIVRYIDIDPLLKKRGYFFAQ